MCIDSKRRTTRVSRRVVLQAATLIALTAGSGFLIDQVDAAAPIRAGAVQSASDDPCRFSTDQAMSKAFGRPLNGSKLVDLCQYRGAGSQPVYVKVTTGTEGTIFRHTKTAFAQGHKGAEKLASSIGEAYFDSLLAVFIGRVGNYEVQIETELQPTPREAMIAAGTQILATLARK